MKNIISLIAFLILGTNMVNAQNRDMSSFMGIAFGSTVAEAKAAFLAKQSNAKTEREDKQFLTFKDVKFGGRDAFAIVMKFSEEGKLHTAVVLMAPDECIESYKLYDDVVSDINDKYYKSDVVVEQFKYPYERKDRENTTALKNGYATFNTLWTFDTRNTPNDSEDDNAILIEILKSCIVKISYQDGVLIDEIVLKNKEKNSADY